MKRKYRIVRDSYNGYEVQHKYWWWPFWIQTNGVNSHRTIDQAEAWARRLYENRGAEKYLGYL